MLPNRHLSVGKHFGLKQALQRGASHSTPVEWKALLAKKELKTKCFPTGTCRLGGTSGRKVTKMHFKKSFAHAGQKRNQQKRCFLEVSAKREFPTTRRDRQQKTHLSRQRTSRVKTSLLQKEALSRRRASCPRKISQR